MAIRVDRLSFDETDQVRHLLRAVAERIGPGELLDLQVFNVRVRLIKTNGAVEPKFLGAAGEAQRCARRFPNASCVRLTSVGVGVISSFAASRLWSWLSQRTQHHRMLAEGNRPPVTVARDVLDGEFGHRIPPIDVQYHVK